MHYANKEENKEEIQKIVLQNFCRALSFERWAGAKFLLDIYEMLESKKDILEIRKDLKFFGVVNHISKNSSNNPGNING